MEFAERCVVRLRARRLAAKALRDHTDHIRRHTALSIEFVPLARLPCPPLLLLVTARPWHRGCRFLLEATYARPLGFVGRFCDAVIGRRLATAAIESFLHELRAAVEEAWKAEQEAWKPPSGFVSRDPALTSV
jgi:hypothetical protein